MFPHPDATAERLQGSVERVTFHSPESGFCVLRIKVRGQRDLVTVIGSAATITPGEYVECTGAWTNDRQHGLQFKTQHLRVTPPSVSTGNSSSPNDRRNRIGPRESVAIACAALG